MPTGPRFRYTCLKCGHVQTTRYGTSAESGAVARCRRCHHPNPGPKMLVENVKPAPLAPPDGRAKNKPPAPKAKAAPTPAAPAKKTRIRTSGASANGSKQNGSKKQPKPATRTRSTPPPPADPPPPPKISANWRRLIYGEA